jgi:hypothetical protein
MKSKTQIKQVKKSIVQEGVKNFNSIQKLNILPLINAI